MSPKSNAICGSNCEWAQGPSKATQLKFDLQHASSPLRRTRGRLERGMLAAASWASICEDLALSYLRLAWLLMRLICRLLQAAFRFSAVLTSGNGVVLLPS